MPGKPTSILLAFSILSVLSCSKKTYTFKQHLNCVENPETVSLYFTQNESGKEYKIQVSSDASFSIDDLEEGDYTLIGRQTMESGATVFIEREIEIPQDLESQGIGFKIPVRMEASEYFIRDKMAVATVSLVNNTCFVPEEVRIYTSADAELNTKTAKLHYAGHPEWVGKYEIPLEHPIEYCFVVGIGEGETVSEGIPLEKRMATSVRMQENLPLVFSAKKDTVHTFELEVEKDRFYQIAWSDRVGHQVPSNENPLTVSVFQGEDNQPLVFMGEIKYPYGAPYIFRAYETGRVLITAELDQAATEREFELNVTANHIISTGYWTVYKPTFDEMILVEVPIAFERDHAFTVFYTRKSSKKAPVYYSLYKTGTMNPIYNRYQPISEPSEWPEFIFCRESEEYYVAFTRGYWGAQVPVELQFYPY